MAALNEKDLASPHLPRYYYDSTSTPDTFEASTPDVSDRFLEDQSNNRTFSPVFKSHRREDGHLLQGPRRVVRLCVFALVIPSLLITVPLYARLVMYAPEHVPMAPSDQRALNHKISSVWCQAQTVVMNGSFNAYLMPGMPSIASERRKHTMLQHLPLGDDVKEYWGFHLLHGSTITLTSCARWDGGQVMMLRGVANLRRCAWLGEEDSSEEDELDSDEDQDEVRQDFSEYLSKNLRVQDYDGEDEIIQNVDPEPSVEMNSDERKEKIRILLKEAMKLSKSKTEILKFMHSEGRKYSSMERVVNKKKETNKMTLNDNERKFVVNNVLTFNNVSNNVTENIVIKLQTEAPNTNTTNIMNISSLSNNDASTLKQMYKLLHSTNDLLDNGNDTKNNKNNVMLRHQRSVPESSEDGAFEIFDETAVDVSKMPTINIDLHENGIPKTSIEKVIRGQIFDPQGLKFDRGSFNQSTMGDGSNEEHRSSYSSSEEALARCEGVILVLPLSPDKRCVNNNKLRTNVITYDIPVTGTYYFVFSSDNEIFKNEIFFNLTMDRVVYNTQDSTETCVNQTECSFPLSFMSMDQAVVEVPTDGDWSNAFVLDANCEPRMAIYMIFILLVPVVIVMCAFQ